MISLEHQLIFTEASIRKYLQNAGFGVPTVFLQQGDKSSDVNEDQIQFLMWHSFPPRGSKNETYGVVNLKAIVRTKVISTDAYRHLRIKSRLVELLAKTIPLLKIGSEEHPEIYDKTQWGILRKIPSETITVTPTSIDVPDASLVEVFYEVLPC